MKTTREMSQDRSLGPPFPITFAFEVRVKQTRKRRGSPALDSGIVAAASILRSRRHPPKDRHHQNAAPQMAERYRGGGAPPLQRRPSSFLAMREHEAATRIQALFKGHRARKGLRAVMEASAAGAIASARRRRRIARLEIEARYLKNLPPEDLETYKRARRDHAAAAIQAAWRARRAASSGNATTTTSAAAAAATTAMTRRRDRAAAGTPTSRTPPSFAEEEDDEDLSALASPNAFTQSHIPCDAFWDAMPRDARRRVAERIRRVAERDASYGDAAGVASPVIPSDARGAVQSAHAALGEYAHTQQIRSRLSRKTTRVYNELMHADSLEAMARSTTIDRAALPPAPPAEGARMARASADHAACMSTARWAARYDVAGSTILGRSLYGKGGGGGGGGRTGTRWPPLSAAWLLERSTSDASPRRSTRAGATSTTSSPRLPALRGFDRERQRETEREEGKGGGRGTKNHVTNKHF